jgi:hypothetical protein
MLELQPGLTIAGFDAYARPFFASNTLVDYLEGLRKAGLQEE